MFKMEYIKYAILFACLAIEFAYDTSKSLVCKSILNGRLLIMKFSHFTSHCDKYVN